MLWLEGTIGRAMVAVVEDCTVCLNGDGHVLGVGLLPFGRAVGAGYAACVV
jgi:hypothetical protein